MGGILEHDGKGKRGMSSSFPSHSSFWFPVILFLSRKFRILGLLGEVLDELGPTLFVAVATWAPGATNWAPAEWAPG